jgi:hypothetical protein
MAAAGGALAGGPHDVGGLPAAEIAGEAVEEATLVANSRRAFQQWEQEVVAMVRLVRDQSWTDGQPILSHWDPIRRAIESLPKPVYDATAYFEKWALGFCQHLMARGVITQRELGEKLGMGMADQPGGLPGGGDATRGAVCHFSPGDAVVVRSEDLSTAWQKPHLRTPGYIFGKAGTVERLCGTFDNPELLSIGLAAAPQPLYRAPRPGIFS